MNKERVNIFYRNSCDECINKQYLDIIIGIMYTGMQTQNYQI
jgi:hypothetical protein